MDESFEFSHGCFGLVVFDQRIYANYMIFPMNMICSKIDWPQLISIRFV